jgi:hypothetical protein
MPRESRSSSKGPKGQKAEKGRSSSRGRSTSEKRGSQKTPQKKKSKSGSRKDVREGGVPLVRNQGVKPGTRDIDFVPANRISLKIPSAYSPTVYSSPLARLAGMIVAKIESIAPLFFGSSVTDATHPTPVLAKACLNYISMIWFKRCGIFSLAATTAALSDVPDDLPVPIPLAKALQQYAPYLSPEGVEFTLSDDSTMPVVTTTTGSLINSGTALNQNNYIEVYPSTLTNGEYARTNGTALANWVDVTSMLNQVMGAIATLFPCIRLGDIPIRAPDASCFVCVDLANLQLTSATSYYDPEVAFFLSPIRDSSGIRGSFHSPVPLTSSTASARGGLAFPTGGDGNLYVGWIEVLMNCPFDRRSVRKMIEKCIWGPMRTFVSQVRDADIRGWHQLVSAEIIQRFNSYPTMTKHEVFILCTVFEAALTARLAEWGYLVRPNICRTWNPAWRDIPLPPFMSIFLWNVGPVVINGRLRLVLPLTSKSWIGISSQADQIKEGLSPGLSQHQGIFFTNVGAAYNSPVAGRTYDNATYGDGTLYAATPTQTADGFSLGYAKIMGYDTTPKGVAPDLNKSFGGLANFSYVTLSASATAGVYTIDTLSFTRYSYSTLGCSTDAEHSRADLALSIMMGWQLEVNPTSGVDNLYTFESDVVNVASLVPVLVSAEQSSDLTDALAFARSKRSKMLAIGGQSTDGDRAGAAAIIAAAAGILGPILANVLPSVVRWATKKITGSKNDGNSTYYSEFGSGLGTAFSEIMERPDVHHTPNTRLSSLEAAADNVPYYNRIRNGYDHREKMENPPHSVIRAVNARTARRY